MRGVSATSASAKPDANFDLSCLPTLCTPLPTPNCPHAAETHQYLLVTVAVGRSYVQEDPASKRDLPSGYDSLYLHGMGQEGAASPADAYGHTYVVFEPAQVLPRYVVHFGYSPSQDAQAKTVGPINLSDIKARVAETLAVLGPAAGMATEKMLSDIGAAYENALASSQEPDTMLEERRRAIRETLRGIDDKLRAVQSNSSSVESALYDALQSALGTLQEETQRKMNLLLAEELELRRQLAAIDWAESFVGTMQQTLPPMSFIAGWERHVAFRGQLYAALTAPGGSGGTLGGRGPSVRVLEEVQPDMRLVGSIQVVTDRTAAAAAASATAQGAAANSAASAGASRYFAAAAAAATAAASASGGTGDASPLAYSNSAAAAATEAAGSPSVEAAAAAVTSARNAIAAIDAAAAQLPPQHRGKAALAKVEAQAQLAAAEKAYAEALLAKALASSAFSGYGGGSGNSAPAAATASGEAKVVPSPAAGSASASPVTSSSPSAPQPSAVTTSPASPAEPSPAAAAAPVAQTPVPPAPPAPVAPASSPAASSSSSSSSAPTPSSTTLTRTENIADRLARFSLRREADRARRARGLGEGGGVDPLLAFPQSRILTPEQASNLYMVLPPNLVEGMTSDGSSSLLATRLLFSTYGDGPSVRSFVERYVTEGLKAPTVVVVKAAGSGAVFGGLAADPWDFTGLFGGSPRSFLFSLTSDVKIPYNGRLKGPKQPNDDFLRQQHEYSQAALQAAYMEVLKVAYEQSGGNPQFDEAGRLLVIQTDEATGQQVVVPYAVPRPKPFVRHDALRSDEGSLQFGLRDLVLTGDFSQCSTELEASYGIGLRPGSAEGRTLLAGAPTFAAEVVEIWAVTPFA